MKILLAVDDSKYSQAAAALVSREIAPAQTEVCVLHVVEPLLIIPYNYIGETPNLDAAQEKVTGEGRELIREIEQRFANANFKVRTELKFGDARTEILDFAAEWDPDLIVLGSHGRKGLDRLLIGSVAQTVARHASCSVMIARERKETIRA